MMAREHYVLRYCWKDKKVRKFLLNFTYVLYFSLLNFTFSALQMQKTYRNYFIITGSSYVKINRIENQHVLVKKAGNYIGLGYKYF